MECRDTYRFCARCRVGFVSTSTRCFMPLGRRVGIPTRSVPRVRPHQATHMLNCAISRRRLFAVFAHVEAPKRVQMVSFVTMQPISPRGFTSTDCRNRRSGRPSCRIGAGVPQPRDRRKTLDSRCPWNRACPWARRGSIPPTGSPLPMRSQPICGIAVSGGIAAARSFGPKWAAGVLIWMNPGWRRTGIPPLLHRCSMGIVLVELCMCCKRAYWLYFSPSAVPV